MEPIEYEKIPKKLYLGLTLDCEFCHYIVYNIEMEYQFLLKLGEKYTKPDNLKTFNICSIVGDDIASTPCIYCGNHLHITTYQKER